MSKKGIYSSLIHNSLKLETQILINRRTLNKWGIFIHWNTTQKLKGMNYNAHNSTDESQKIMFNNRRHTHTTKPMGGGENYVSKVEAMRKPEGGIKLKMIGSTEQCFKTFFKFISSFDKFTYLWTFSIAVDESTVLRIIDIKISYLFCTPLLSIVCFMKFFDFVNIKSQSSIRILKLHNLSRFYYVQFPSPLCEG